MILIFLFFGLLFKLWCVFFVLVVVVSSTFTIVFVLFLFCRGVRVMSKILYSRVFAFVFGEIFVLFCVIFFYILFFGFWVFFSLLFGSIENTLLLIVIGVIRGSIFVCMA
jgi:hypothetical protein